MVFVMEPRAEKHQSIPWFKHETGIPVFQISDDLRILEPTLFPYIPRTTVQYDENNVPYIYTGFRSDWYHGRHRVPGPDAIILEPTWPQDYVPGTARQW